MAEPVNQLHKGMHSDNAEIAQPKDTYRYALNGVMQNDQGQENLLGAEEGNSFSFSRNSDVFPLGSVYVGDGNTVIFFAKFDGSKSEIGIVDEHDNYTVIVDDEGQVNRLNFRVTNQIDAVFRLRKGCERVIYFTDNLNKPRIFNLDAVEKFKDDAGDWDPDKFNLVKQYTSIPTFEEITITEDGSLPAGSYNAAIQYLDEDLNPTEWISTSDTIIIYNDRPTSKNFADVRGSTNAITEYQRFGPTNKAITFTFGNLDQDFPLYRVAIIEANNGSGNVSRVVFSDERSTESSTYVYTGLNAQTIGTEEEIAQFSTIIQRAEHVEQVDNMLMIGNTSDKNINWCTIQKYASKVRSKAVYKPVTLNNITLESNPKRGTANVECVGYMPGEIYSFGIVYVFEDGSTSPVFHIPGRNVNDQFSNMSTDNECANTTYTALSTCEEIWGVDSEGDALLGESVRHHRFPTRGEVNKPLVVSNQVVETETLYTLTVTVTGNVNDTGQNSPGNYNSQLFRVRYTLEKETGSTHDGSNDVAVLSDSTASWVTDQWVGFVIKNTTDGSEGTITANTATTITATLSGGTEDDWDTGDAYTIETAEQIKQFSFATPNLGDFLNYVSEEYVVEETECPITDVVIEEFKPTDNSWQAEGAWIGVSYNDIISTTTVEIATDISTSELFGIEFSNIDIPSIAETDGVPIVGAYIVRTERDDANKSIVDTGVLTPIRRGDPALPGANEDYLGFGLLYPNTSDLIPDGETKGDLFGLIHPEHKFRGKENSNITEIVQQGEFALKNKRLSSKWIEDVQPGTSYDPEIHKRRERDSDGFGLNVMTRNTTVKYNPLVEDTFSSGEDIKDIFYLDAMHHKTVIDIDNEERQVFNATSDNKIGVVQINTDKYPSSSSSGIKGRMPYVALKKSVPDPYGDFRTLPYYKEHMNMFNVSAGSTENTFSSIFNGDVYISSMRYTNTMYWDTELKSRDKKAALGYIFGALAIVGGILLAGPTGGASVALIAWGLSQAAAGVRQSVLRKTIIEDYENGLRETISDIDILQDEVPGLNRSYPDDGLLWFTESVQDLWFETPVNMNWRMGATESITDFKNSPSFQWEALNSYSISKVTSIDNKGNGGRNYLGFAKPEIYEVNPDYYRRDRQKIYFHLPLEFDCCTDCPGEFPQRIHYSEQSFQEELTDNYRVFLPNNYRDIPGETGEVTDLFTIQSNLYAHTEEGLWHMPRSYQERVTGDIVSFLGTGSYFEIPPQKIVDDETGHSAGTRHKWGTVKTPQGVFFSCESQGQFYQFNGNKLIPISSKGMFNWSKENMPLQQAIDYEIGSDEEYPFNNNPSNPWGIGYIATYDSQKERVIFTKRDFALTAAFSASGEYLVCQKPDGDLVVFEDFNAIIAKNEGPDETGTHDGANDAAILTDSGASWTDDEWIGYTIQNTTDGSEGVITDNDATTITVTLAGGTDNDWDTGDTYVIPLQYTYNGLSKCRMEFVRTDSVNTNVNQYTADSLANDTDFIFHLDMQNDTYGSTARTKIKAAANAWKIDYAAANPSWTGDIYFSEQSSVSDSKRWVRSLKYAVDETDIYETGGGPASGLSNNLFIFNFIIHSNSDYHDGTLDDPMDAPTSTFNSDYSEFTTTLGTHTGGGGTFRGLLYPIVFNNTAPDSTWTDSRVFFQHALGAMRGSGGYTALESQEIDENYNIFWQGAPLDSVWHTMINSLTNTNTYPAGGMEQHGYEIVLDIGQNVSNDGDIINEIQIQGDLKQYLLDNGTFAPVSRPISTNTYLYDAGTIVAYNTGFIDSNHFTISYDLRREAWISLHSYLPIFYFHTPNQFTSLQYDSISMNNRFFKHNAEGLWLEFMENAEPFIVEYVQVENPLQTMITDGITWRTMAESYNSSMDSFSEERLRTFNKLVAYNSRQCTGELTLKVKDEPDTVADYMEEQTENLDNSIVLIDNQESQWTLNDLRDYRTDYTVPIWRQDLTSLQVGYYNDKVLNTASISYNKDWTQLESFRDKYLVIRFIFDNFTDVKLTFNYSVGTEIPSTR